MHSDAPNYITPLGVERLRAQVKLLIARRNALAGETDRLGKKDDLQRIDRDLVYFQERLRRAIVVTPPDPPFERVVVGATVTLADETGTRHEFTIVGEDETDVAAGRISWTSPLGRAVMQKQLGDAITWQKPTGDMDLEITAINYR